MRTGEVQGEHFVELSHRQAYHDLLDPQGGFRTCLLYTSDAADERSSVDLGGRRIIKKKQSLALSSSSRAII